MLTVVLNSKDDAAIVINLIEFSQDMFLLRRVSDGMQALQFLMPLFAML